MQLSLTTDGTNASFFFAYQLVRKTFCSFYLLVSFLLPPLSSFSSIFLNRFVSSPPFFLFPSICSLAHSLVFLPTCTFCSRQSAHDFSLALFQNHRQLSEAPFLPSVLSIFHPYFNISSHLFPSQPTFPFKKQSTGHGDRSTTTSQLV